MTDSAVELTLLAALATPIESWEFFTSVMWDPGCVGFVDYLGNQSLKGAIARGLPETVWNLTWTTCSLLAVMVARFLRRRLDRLWGAGGTAGGIGRDNSLTLSLQINAIMVLGLLISLISRSYHWVRCLPMLVSVVVTAWCWHSTIPGATGVVGFLAFVMLMQWWFPEQNHAEQNWLAWARAVGSSYVWWALGRGAVLWWVSGRRPKALHHREPLRAAGRR